MDSSAVASRLGELGLGEMFTLLFVMLGPLKLLGPFAQVTRELSGPERGRFAFQAAAISTIAVLAGGLVGAQLIAKWNVSLPALTLAAGLVFLLVALDVVLRQFDAAPAAPGPAPRPSSFRFSFPNVVTPYGVAAVIIFFMVNGERMGPVVGLIVAVLAVDLLAMLFARQILSVLAMPLQVLGVVLGVAQVALAIQIILNGLRAAGVVAAAPL